MSELMPAVASLKKQLSEKQVDYFCGTLVPAAVATVTFIGPFQGRLIVWNMTLAALAHGRKAVSTGITGGMASTVAGYAQPYIEISVGVEGVHMLRVGLDLAEIDEPAIRKTIIMIRNYKRLELGRMAFGGVVA